MNNKINIFEDYDSFTKFTRDILFYLDSNSKDKINYSNRITILCSPTNCEKLDDLFTERFKSLGFEILYNKTETVETSTEGKFEGVFGEFFKNFKHQDGHIIGWKKNNAEIENDFIIQINNIFITSDKVFKELKYNI